MHSFAGWRIHRDAFLPPAQGDGAIFFARTEDGKCPQVLGDPRTPPSSLSKVIFFIFFHHFLSRLWEADFAKIQICGADIQTCSAKI